ncbi:sperm flagellar protein 1-like [Anneissia japonica]|uniref:sperm flagellar protein 1-like n=1 Tax=Anneissia japonica TaxID=1529436 RepID=UPI0014256253|nr:sperm flagellar protein 1-like [Anneissia japonica]
MKEEIDWKMSDPSLEEEKLQELYAWIDNIHLSRPKRSITRDFSDGVLTAEVVANFLPKLVELHNYTPANSTQQKQNNWGTLNRKVFSKLNFHVPENVIRGVIMCKQGLIEMLLWQLKLKIENFIRKRNSGVSKMSPDSYDMISDRSDKGHHKVGKYPGSVPKGPGTLPNATNAARSRSLQNVNLEPLSSEARYLIEEKEQALLVSQETVQILQAKIRRLEHLLQLKDIRIEELGKKIHQMEGRY